MKWIIAIIGLLTTAVALAGCGGGGGGGGSTGSSSGSSSGGGGGSTTYTLGGTVVNSAGVGLVGVTVSLDNLSNETSAATTTGGAWTISNIPASDIGNSTQHKLVVTYNGVQYPEDLPSFSGFSDTNIQLTPNVPPPPPSSV